MQKERWADMDDDAPWPDPPDYGQVKKYVPPPRRPRVAPKKPPPEEKEKNTK